jgi:hypothetical protein
MAGVASTFKTLATDPGEVSVDLDDVIEIVGDIAVADLTKSATLTDREGEYTGIDRCGDDINDCGIGRMTRVDRDGEGETRRRMEGEREYMEFEIELGV